LLVLNVDSSIPFHSILKSNGLTIYRNAFYSCVISLIPNHRFCRLFQGLRFHLFGDPVFDTLVFFFGNLLSDFPIGWVAAENECVEEGDAGHSTCHDETQQ